MSEQIQNQEGEVSALVSTYGHDVETLGHWRLMWMKFLRQKLAVASGIVIILLYMVALFADFLAPFDPQKAVPKLTYAPPQSIHFFVEDENGESHFQLHVNAYKVTIDKAALRRVFTIDEDKIIPLKLFVEGADYKLFGFIPSNIHLIGPANPNDPFFLLGADRIGRDGFSRVLHGTRVSMSIGLIGVAVALFLGMLLGGLSGYYGGVTDMVIQRAIEVLSSIPTIPLWMGLAAAIPLTWSPLHVYFIITLIVSLLGWTSLAREVRGRFMALKTDAFVTSAILDGSSELRVIFRHMMPSLTSHIIATLTLAIPAMIIAETSLSFLGIGLKPPVVSWGVLLQDSQNVRAVAQAPWLLAWPGGAIVLAVLAFNFLGDGLRDAADPYSH
ncbi:MAG: ABC transporter permease [Alphaproteobacteria bacterium]|nr:ABC transporter permease [Alphaproteobacteria bacterium]